MGCCLSFYSTPQKKEDSIQYTIVTYKTLLHKVGKIESREVERMTVGVFYSFRLYAKDNPNYSYFKWFGAIINFTYWFSFSLWSEHFPEFLNLYWYLVSKYQFLIIYKMDLKIWFPFSITGLQYLVNINHHQYRHKLITKPFLVARGVI